MSVRPPRLGIRSKLLLVLLVFLAIPLLGYAYIRELEGFLRQSQERTLVGTAEAVATALHDRPALFAPRAASEEPPARARDGTGPADAAPSPEIDEILQGLSRTTSRIFVVDARSNVLARAGSLHHEPAAEPVPDSTWMRLALGVEKALVRSMYAWMLRQPTEEFNDDFLGRGLPFAPALEGALSGILTTDRRPSRDGRVTIVAAAHPIWVGDRVLGAVVVEETTNAVLTQRNRAFERLFTWVLAVTLIGAAALTVFASRLSSRIRSLRDEVERAIDARGRVTGIAAGSSAGDEIGDLSRSFSDVLGRLAESSKHREELASRLSHELRTPIAVVRSSLDNLQADAGDEAARAVYLDRARGGLDRLTAILTRMSEATRLEQGIDDAEREHVDLAALVRACVDGYRMAYADRRFVLEVPEGPLMLRAAPDLVAQMLDKLVANAVEFGTPGTPVAVRVEQQGDEACLSAFDQGPPLAEGTEGRLFEAMVSVRDPSQRGAGPHLGLGLYIVRLIAQAHGGRASAENVAGGVRVGVVLPLAAA